MILEKEKKFLVELDFVIPFLEKSDFVEIDQGYLVIDDEYHIRIRNTYSYHEEAISELGLKVKSIDGFLEKEIKIPPKVGIKLFDKCQFKLTKKRINIDYNIIIDVYPDGDIVCEVEYTDQLIIPSFCLEEVKDYNRYSNIKKAIEGNNLSFSL